MSARHSADRRTARIAVLALGIVIASVLPLTPAGAQTPQSRTGEPGQPGATPSTDVPAAVDPASGETTRVIVELTTPTRPAAELAPSAEAAQQQAIADTQAEVDEALTGTDSEVVATFEHVPGMAVETTAEGLDRLRTSPSVAAVRPDHVARPLLDESTQLVRADEAWPTATGAGYSVAVLDTGVDRDHDSLDGRVVHEACFADDTIVGNAPAGDCPNGRNNQSGNEVAGVAIDATDGSFTLTYDAQTTAGIAFDAGAQDVQTALEALGSIDTGQVAVTGAPGGYDIEFTGGLGRQDLTDLTADGTNLTADNEVASVTIDATGGTFTLTYEAEPTTDIAFDASAQDVQTALEALGSIDTGQVAVTGAPGGYDIEFTGGLGLQNLTDLTADGTNLTGGAGTAVVTVLDGGAGTAVVTIVDGGPDGGPGAAAPCTLADCFHGSHVAGIAASDGDTASDGNSYPGVARGANIVAQQVFHTDGSRSLAYFSDIVEALDNVYTIRDDHSVAAVNMSLGGFLFDGYCDNEVEPLVYASVQNLKDEGVVTVVSSGNDGSTTGLSFPACLSNVISVGSVLSGKNGTQTDGVASNSNASSVLRMLAPGAPITSSVPDGTAPRNDVAEESGTSMAAPHVAGAVALLREAGVGAGFDEIDLADHLHGVLRASGPCVYDPGSTGVPNDDRKYARLDVKAAVDWDDPPSAFFWDVACGVWYEGAADFLGFDPDGTSGPLKPLATGFPDGSFGGNKKITRGQDARMLYRLFGEPDPSPYTHSFNDVPNWVTSAVNWVNWPGGPASPEPLMTGTGSSFDPNDNITRGEKARQLYRAAGSEPIDPSCPSGHGFSDVPGWINTAVRWLTCPAHGPGGTTPIATGYNDPANTFRPNNAITRAEAGRMLERFDEAGHAA